MIRPISPPILVSVFGVDAELTHGLYTFDARPDHVLSRCQPGCVGEGGEFESGAPLVGMEEISIIGEDFDYLMAARGGKRAARYRNDDVAEVHDAIRQRRATEAANAAAANPSPEPV